MRYLYKVLLGFIPLLLATAAFAQTTLTTTGTGYTSLNGCGAGTNTCFITFVVNNTNASGIILTGVSSQTATTDNGASVTLWQSTTSLSGPVTLPTGFTSVATGTVSGVTATTINPVLTNLNILIPANMQVRFALQISTNNAYAGTITVTPTPNTFTSGGVSLHVGDFQIAGQNVGYGGPNTPRAFLGSITFIPALPCVSPPTAGITTTSATTVCANTAIQLGLNGNSQGTSQTYQLLAAASATGPYTPVGTPQNGSIFAANPTATTFYRIRVVCGTGVDTSTPVQVTVPGLFPGGTYTINAGAPASATNFQSFAAAVQAMLCGISGPVVFNVSGTAPYAEQLYLPSTIVGTSATNTITFNGNNNVLNFTATNSDRRGGIMIDDVDWVTVNDLTVNVNTTASTFGFGVQLINNADNNTIRGCTINIDSSVTSSLFAGMVINGSLTSATGTGTGNCDSNRFLNNIVKGGYYGMTCVGNSTALFVYNNLFRGNTVRNPYFYGIYSLYTNGLVVDSNDISRPTRPVVSSFYGVALSTGSVGATVSRNRLHNVFDANLTSTGIHYGLYAATDATTAQPNRWVNNMVYNIHGGAAQYGIYNTGADNNLYHHNTIALEDTAYTGAAVAYGLYQTTAATGTDVRNNIFVVRRGGTGIKAGLYFNTPATTFTSNYNDFHIAGATGVNNIGYYTATGYATLTAWQAGTGKDSVSVDVNPQLTSPATGNLTPTNAAVDNLGQPIGVLVDAFGNPRSLTAPDMGAIEWSSIPPCGVPTFLIAANVSSNSATLFWTAPTTPPTGYQYVVSTTNTTPTGAGTPVAAPPVTVTGLNPGVTYYFFVRSDCGSNNFSTWAVDSFTTCIPPVATLTAIGATAICQGDSAVLKANGGAGFTYQFFQNGVSLGSTAGDSILYATQAGSYTVIATNLLGCSDTSAALTVTVNPLPMPAVSQVNANTLTTTTTFAAYQWILGGNAIAGATGQTYVATQNGAYSVRVTDANGCVGTSNAFNLTTTSVGGTAAAIAAIRVFPNPTTGVLFIESKMAVHASVWTLDGRKLMDIAETKNVDLQGLPAGVYMLRLSDPQGTLLLTERVTKLD